MKNKNKNGFTLIELMGVLLILAILLVLVTPGIQKLMDYGQERSYNMILENSKTAASNYITECNSGILSSTNCEFNWTSASDGRNSINIKAQILADLGLLKASDIVINGQRTKYLKDPRSGIPENKQNLGECLVITIYKETDTNIYDYEVNNVCE